MRPDQCLLIGAGTDIDALVTAGRLHPGDAVEIKRFRACIADVAARVAAGADRGEAWAAAYAEHYPEDRQQPGRGDHE